MGRVRFMPEYIIDKLRERCQPSRAIRLSQRSSFPWFQAQKIRITVSYIFRSWC